MASSIILNIIKAIAAKLPMLLAGLFVLGIMIFVHELGHYMAARLSKMRVDAFAFGFGPSIFRRRRGPTVFMINIIPLGGYCKVAGMEIDDYDVPDGFNRKPAWARFLVIVAGVLMNLLLAFLFFFFWVLIWGDSKPQIVVNQIFPDSVISEQALDLRVGDVIDSVNGKTVKDYLEFINALKAVPPDGNAEMDITRNGTGLSVTIPRREPAPVGKIGAQLVGNTIFDVVADTPARKAGLRAKDRIIAVNGEPIVSKFDIFRTIGRDGGQKTDLTIERPGQPEPVVVSLVPLLLKPENMYEAELIFRRFGFNAAPEIEQILKVSTVLPGSPSEKIGFRKGDIINSINGAPVFHPLQVRELLENSLGRTVRIGVQRDGADKYFNYDPEVDWTTKAWLQLNFERDIMFKMVRYRAGIIRSLTLGWRQFVFGIESIVFAVVKLVQREIPASVGGPVSVIRIASNYTLDQMIWFTASLSIFLALFNLLPVPGLDGARLLIVVIESVVRRRINRIVEYYIHMVGFVLLMGLLFVITYMDIWKWVTGKSVF